MEPEREPSSRSQSFPWLLVLLGIPAVVLWFRSKVVTDPLSKSANAVYGHNSTSQRTDDPGADSQLRVSLAKTSGPPTPAECHYPAKKVKRWWKRWKPWVFLLNLLTFIALAYYACITRGMWKEMQKQTINSERAWVGLDGPLTLDTIDITPKAGEINGHYTLKNFGHGPALKVVQFGSFVDLDTTMAIQKREADSYCNGAVDFTNGTVPVGGEMKQPGAFGYTLFPGQQHAELIQFGGNKIPEKTLRFLRFIGCVAYIDQFKTTHWTRFCMERKPGSPPTPVGEIPKLDFCSMYNDTDEPKPH